MQADGRHLVRVDPVTGASRAHAFRKDTPAARGSDGSIWMPDKEQNIVYRIDPRRAAVIDSFGGGPGAFVAIKAYGSMWVTSYAGSISPFRP